MPISTAGDLIMLALRTSGILGQGQSAAAEDSSDALNLLNMMIEQWQRKRWLTWSLVDTFVVSTGAQSYQVGSGFAFNVPRPDKINSAFARLLGGASGPLDVPLGIIPSREDYNNIALKSLSTWLGGVFYDPAFPVGVLYFWPVPAAGQFELHIATKAHLPYYNDLNAALNLPPEYTQAALYSLAVQLTMGYGLPTRPDHVGAMRAALNTIRVSNAAVPTLGLPGAVLPRRGGSIAASADPRFQSGLW
jgi:hypothetical protein